MKPRASTDPNDRSPGPVERFGPALLALAAAAVVFHRALGYFFSQDDFAGLARAAGLLPRLTGPWRWLSGQAYFDAMRAAVGLDAFAYHLASLMAHLGCVLLLFLLLARRFSRPAALAGAVFFAVHPALYTAVFSISGIGEILALLFGLGALLAIGTSGRARWLAVPLFALSLLSKESTLLLPIAALIGAGSRTEPPSGPGARRESRAASAAEARRGPDAVLVTLGLVAFVHLLGFVAGDLFGVRTTVPLNAPYAVGLGSNLGENLLSYLGWTVNFLLPTMRRFTDAVDPGVFIYAIAAVALWLALLGWRRLRTRDWMSGAALYLLLLLPVLPLRNHTYHYYLYAPLTGAAWCLAALFDAVTGQVRGNRTRWIAAAAMAVFLTANGALLVRKIESFPFVFPDMRADPTVDRARIARNVRDGLRSGDLPEGASVIFWSPTSVALGRRQRADSLAPDVETYWERNVRNALMDGLAVRVLFPRVPSVSFVRDYAPTPPSTRWAVYRRDGHLRLASPSELDSVVRMFPQPR